MTTYEMPELVEMLNRRIVVTEDGEPWTWCGDPALAAAELIESQIIAPPEGLFDHVSKNAERNNFNQRGAAYGLLLTQVEIYDRAHEVHEGFVEPCARLEA